MSAVGLSVPRESSRLGFSWPLLVAVVAFPLLLRSGLLNDADTYWHVGVGRWMLTHWAVPETDLFSHSYAGAPWVAHEWLAEVLYAGAYMLGGWGAVVVLTAAAFASALAILCRFLLRHLEPIYGLLAVAAAASLAAPHLLARPHALVLPLLVSWCVVLVRACEEGHRPALPWALLMVLWANLHGSFPLGFGLAAVFALEALLAAPSRSQRHQVLRSWGGFLLLAALGMLVTPHGLGGLRHVFYLQGMSITDTISEWRSPNFHYLQPLEFWLMVVAAAAFSRGLRLPPIRLALLLGLLHLALRHARHAEILGLLAPIIVAQSIGAQWCSQPRGVQQAEVLDRFFRKLAAPAKPVAVLLVLLVFSLLSWGVVRVDMLRPVPDMTPEAAVQAALAKNPPGPVLNAFEFGGYLIFRGIPVFVDGRADLYGDRFLSDYLAAIKLNSPERLVQLLEKYCIGWTLLQPGTPATALLDRLPEWHQIYIDQVSVVHVKEQFPSSMTCYFSGSSK